MEHHDANDTAKPVGPRNRARRGGDQRAPAPIRSRALYTTTAMVLLTMTPATVRALSRAGAVAPEELAELQLLSEPSLADPAPGEPVSHSQLIALSKLLKKHAPKGGIPAEGAHDARESSATEEGSLPEEDTVPASLDALLRGSRIYIPPPPPKKEPTPEYVALMARLRAEEEARAYERMLHPNPLAKVETFSQRFPATPPFSIGTHNDVDEDEVSYAEVHRQIILIINVLVSIVACSVFIWVAARHWSAPKRLGLSMGGSLAVAVAEVVVYSGYVRRVAEAKRREKKKPEIKEIVRSWAIDGGIKDDLSIASASKDKADDLVRYRKGKHR